MRTEQLYIISFSLLIVACIKIFWGCLAVWGCRNAKSFLDVFYNWDFRLGMTMFSSGLFFIIASWIIFPKPLLSPYVDVRLRVLTFVSINVAWWTSITALSWWQRRFERLPPTT